MHLYRLRHYGLASSLAEKSLKYPAKKVITVNSWVNMGQEHALIANKANCVMSFIRGIMARILEKINILYLVLVKPPLQYWVQFWLSHFKRRGGKTGDYPAVGCQDGQGPRTCVLQR